MPRKPFCFFVVVAMVATVSGGTGNGVARAAPAAPVALGAAATGCPAYSVATYGVNPNALVNDGGGTQLITEVGSYTSTTATFTAWNKGANGCWAPAPLLGQPAMPYVSEVGYKGLIDHRLEKDGATPTGLYTFQSTFYGISTVVPNPLYAYHHLICGDWWDEDSSDPQYNQFVHAPCGTNPKFGPQSEALWTFTQAYQHFAVINFNPPPTSNPIGSGIFMHDDTSSGVTAGCIALPNTELDAVLGWMNPAANPHILIGTRAEMVQLSSLATGPSQAVAGNGNRYVFYRGSDGNLWQLLWDGSAWRGPYYLGMGPLGSEPSADIDGSGSTSVFWRGADGNVWEGFWTGTAWSGARLVGMGPLGSQPTATVTTSGTQYVFWRGADGNLWQAIGASGGPWSGPYDLGMGPLGSPPSADVDTKGNTSVFWRGGDGNLWEGYWTGSGWSGARLAEIGPLNSQPTATVAANGTQYVFWTGANENVWQGIGVNGGPWGGPYFLGMGPLGSVPSAGVDRNGSTSLVWKGADSNLWQAYWTGSAWTGAVGVGIPVG